LGRTGDPRLRRGRDARARRARMSRKGERRLPDPKVWRPRDYQFPLWDYLNGGGLRADVVAHRRWGKDEIALHWTAAASRRRVGSYWHLLPEASQARKAIWDAV